METIETYWNIRASVLYLFTFSDIVIINIITSAALQAMFSVLTQSKTFDL